MKIPITMCHGVSWQPQKVKRGQNLLNTRRFESYFEIASTLGFESISYEDLAAWRAGGSELPQRPIMFDFDHPDWSIGRLILPIMSDFGYTANLFINTSPMEKVDNPHYMNWDEIGELVQAGWHIGAHTHHHYPLDYLARRDPSGGLIREELEKCDEAIREHLGLKPVDFAYTGTTWSHIAELEVAKRYRFGRLWITGGKYETDDGEIRYADLVGIPGPDEPDGGPPHAARYIAEDSHPLRLPSMELEHLIFEYDAFRDYLLGALTT